jgi:hypothetical protein
LKPTFSGKLTHQLNVGRIGAVPISEFVAVEPKSLVFSECQRLALSEQDGNFNRLRGVDTPDRLRSLEGVAFTASQSYSL